MRRWALYLTCVSLGLLLGCEAPKNEEPATTTQSAVTGEKSAEPAPAAEAKAETPQGDSEEITAIVKRVEKLGGKIEREKSGKIVGVDLLDCPARDDDIKLLTALPNLQRLGLWGAEITDAGVAQLKAFQGLTELELENTEVHDAALPVIKELKNLKSLSLRRNTYLTDKAMATVKELPKLQTLGLMYNNITDSGLAELKDKTELRSLDLRGCVLITDAGLEHLKALKNLKALKL
ncbi:MAG: hypothetical protein ABFD16_26475, partial [Thermoguttaceae bacterium]